MKALHGRHHPLLRRHFHPTDMMSIIPILSTVAVLGMFRFGPKLLGKVTGFVERSYHVIRGYLISNKQERALLNERRLRNDEAAFKRIDVLLKRDLDIHEQSRLIMQEFGKISWRTKLFLPVRAVTSLFGTRKPRK